jgi:hypothetical protein
MDYETWTQALPRIVEVLLDANSSDAHCNIAYDELQRMAAIADKYVKERNFSEWQHIL